MADKDQSNEEYQITEMDPLNPSSYEETPTEKNASSASGGSKLQSFMGDGQVKQKAFIAVGMFILISLIYKFIGPHFDDKKLDTLEKVAPAVIPPPPPPLPESTMPKKAEVSPIQASQQGVVNEGVPSPSNAEVEKKLNDLEARHESISSNLSALGNQVSTINGNLEGLTKQVSDLSNTVTALSQKLESMAQELVQKREKIHIHKASPTRHRRIIIPYSKFYLQAVIPGRAWLVSTGGDTLTVRDGSLVPGYGHVTLIDPNQGRVITTSGKTIRFSQQDS